MCAMIISSEHDLYKFSNKLMQACRQKLPMVIHLLGELGAGKTTFVRACLRSLQYTDHVKSPTFGLLEVYELDKLQICHFDLYRLHDPQGLEDLAFRDYLHSADLIFIEWPTLAKAYLPNPDIQIKITNLGGEKRELDFHGFSKSGQALMQKIM